MTKTQLKNIAKLKLRKHRKLNLLYTQNFFRIITNPIRVYPNFIIAGGIKCGTTSLYNYLIQHPNIFPASRKETKFFDLDYELGINWYKPYFPTKIKKYFLEKFYKKKFLTGESTPAYFHHPLVPKRIFEEIPKIKLIFLLRNPIDRAYSDYNMRKRAKLERLTFEAAIEKEISLIKKGENLLEKLELQDYFSKFKPYLSRGHYYSQLQSWFNFFPRNQIHIGITEDLLENPQDILNEIFSFLKLSDYNIPNLEKQNVGSYEKLSIQTRSLLNDYFKPHNEKLYKFLGKNLNWK